MKLDSHERARLLIDEALAAPIAAEELTWLKGHTRECAACRDYSELSGKLISGLRALAFDTDPQMTTRVMEAISKHKAPRRISRWFLAAAAVLVMAAIPALRFAREVQRERADALFMESVQMRLSRTVPVALEPLTRSAR